MKQSKIESGPLKSPKSIFRIEKKFVSQGDIRAENSLSYHPPKNVSGDLSLNLSLLPSLSSHKQVVSLTTRKTEKTVTLMSKNPSVKYFEMLPSLNMNKQTASKQEVGSRDLPQLSDKFDLFPTRSQRVQLVEKLSEFKSALDSVNVSAIESAGSTLAPLFSLFDGLISDNSYFSSTMRTFSSLLQACLFFSPASTPASMLSLIHATHNNSFKQIFFGSFGQSHPQSYFDLLRQTVQVYQKDTEYLESLLVEQKGLTEKQVEIVKMLGKELAVKDTLLAGTQTGEQVTGGANGDAQKPVSVASVTEFKSKLDVFEYKNNFEFEGKLIKAAFMENYGQLLSLVDGYRETEAQLKKQLHEATLELEFLRAKHMESGKHHSRLQHIREDLDVLSVGLVEAWHRVDKPVNHLLRAARTSPKTPPAREPVVHEANVQKAHVPAKDIPLPITPPVEQRTSGEAASIQEQPDPSQDRDVIVRIAYPETETSHISQSNVPADMISPAEFLEAEKQKLEELNKPRVLQGNFGRDEVIQLADDIGEAVKNLFESIDQITNCICKLDEVLYDQPQQ